MKRLLLIIAALLFFSSGASAASRFWVPLTVTNAVSGTGGLCRLTVNDTTNLSAGIAVIVANIVGATACDGTTTVTTVINATTVEVNLTFNLAYTSGGTVAGGNWTATGTGNWASSSGGAGGQTVPGSADDVTFDGSSGGGTVTVNTTVNIKSLTGGAHTGTLDFSANNNNVTVQSVSYTGSGTRTLKLGNGTWTITGGGGVTNLWNIITTTNLTFNANSSTLSFTPTTVASRIFTPGGLTYNTVNISGNSTGSQFQFNNLGAFTITTLNISAPNNVQFVSSTTLTATTLTASGSSGSEIFLQGTVGGSQATISIASGTQALSWTAIRDMAFTGGATFTAANSFNLGDNSGITITAPAAAGGGGCILGGWLLYRDLPHNLNDNFPAWLEKAA